MALRRQSLSASQARRIALAAQGFDRSRPAAPNDKRHFRRVLNAVTVLQMDFVNVLLPAHLMIVWSRLGAYDRKRFLSFVYDSGEYIEQWAHEASIVSAVDWPLLGHRRRRYEPWKSNPLNQLPDRDQYLREVLARVRERGPLASHDLPAVEGPKRNPGDWHRSVPRWALEFHFGRGKLAVRERLSNFQRLYDIPERVISDRHRQNRVRKAEAQRELLRKSARALGVATLQDLADYYRMSPRDAAPLLAELVEEGTLAPISVEGWSDPAYLAVASKIPHRINGSCLLSPFDPVVWFRPRASRLFDFEYRIEIYVPAKKRRWGYYVLPFRLHERIVARVDLKADRAGRQLLVQSVHPEHDIDEFETASALARELRTLANWLDLDCVTVRPDHRFSRLLVSQCMAL